MGGNNPIHGKAGYAFERWDIAIAERGVSGFDGLLFTGKGIKTIFLVPRGGEVHLNIGGEVVLLVIGDVLLD